ncbi:MAG: aldehyde ferredoxin oxidoreductase family protein, partial [Candidatus Bathyarchaeia archaeon]
MQLLGYVDRLLYVDLSRRRFDRKKLGEERAKKYIGGMGLAIGLTLENTAAGVDAFSPENILAVATGPLGGTIAPTAANGHAFAAKSPQTGCIGESKVRGHFGTELKRSGLDALIFMGKAEKPVYLFIDDGSPKLVDASPLWGKSPEETEKIVRRDHDDPYIRVAAIGIAGERLTRIASIMSDSSRVAGRTGLGAVMGSKNLKAIAVRGNKNISVADPEEFIRFCEVLHERAKGPTTEKYRVLGTAGNLSLLNKMGALPVRNFAGSVFEGASNVNGEYLNKHYVTDVIACAGCPMGCEHLSVVREGNYKGVFTRTEFGPLWSFGPHCDIDRLDAVIEAICLSNHYGIDAVSAGNVIGFAMECYERGLLTREETGGLELKFGDHEAMLNLLHKIGKR